jgi:hypothetical protein
MSLQPLTDKMLAKQAFDLFFQNLTHDCVKLTRVVGWKGGEAKFPVYWTQDGSVFLKNSPAGRNASRSREPSSLRQSPKAVLIDFQRFNLRFQRRPWYAQLPRGPCGSKYTPSACF